MSKVSFLTELEDRILVCDGAFGTLIRIVFILSKIFIENTKLPVLTSSKRIPLLPMLRSWSCIDLLSKFVRLMLLEFGWLEK